jgi:uncharacterized repeat protein (TIGR01451 family)
MKKSLLNIVFLFATVLSYSQLYEGFENTTGPDALPSTNWTLGSGNWTVFNSTNNSPIYWTITSIVSVPTQVYQGTKAAYCNRSTNFQNGPVENYLVTPMVTIPVDGQLRFQTRAFLGGIQGTKYQIKVAPATASPTDASAFTTIQEWTDGTLNQTSPIYYEQKTVNLSAYAGQDVYVAFVMRQEAIQAPFGDRWFIDDVHIGSSTDCYYIGQCPQELALIAFLDSNNNGIKDANEAIFIFGSFVYQINNSGNTLYGANNYGYYYIFDNNPLNSYTISFAVNSNLGSYYTCTTTHNNITLPTGSGTNILYFPVANPNPFKDVSLSLTPLSPAKPNYLGSYQVEYKNLGTQIINNGTVTFTKDPNISIIYGVPSDIEQTPTGFTHNFTNLAPLETRSFNFIFNIPNIPTVQLGDLLTSSAYITINDDVNLANNTAILTQTVVGAFDPNDIMESHGEKIVFEDFTTDDYLIYTIRFENTGTANAEFIRIEDALDSQLDENTFELLSASHDVNVRRDGTALTFHFYDINLPPSTININDGHGYVQFKIKPKAGYAIGDVIPNTASIFFDTNPAIVTNTFNTEFVQALNTSTFTQANVVIYPNPATSYVQVALNNSAENISTITLMDVLGKTILKQQQIGANQTIINTASLSKGIYLIKITSETNESVVKKMIIQ